MQIPKNFVPRQYQLPLMKAIDGGCRKAFALWHRRAGKDIVLWNMIIKKAIESPGLYFYFLPTYTQGKKIIWDGINNDGFKFLDYLPDELVIGKNGQEMKITFWNGSIVQIIGTDHYDSIRGTNPRGCVFSEYAFQHPLAWEVVKPILKVNKGWAVFNTTPNGKNHAYDLYEVAQGDPKWFSETLTINDTKVLDETDMDEERYEGMTEEMIQQEYYCSFDIGTLGAYFASNVREANRENRICSVPIEKHVPIDLYLDLGKNDLTAIIFVQTVGREIRVVDYFEHNGEDVAYYAKVLDDKGYRYGTMYLPHDATHNRMESRKTIQKQFEEAGFKTSIVRKAEIKNGINEVRKIFPRIWFDTERTKYLVKALENYHKEYDELAKVFKPQPKHDWSSHACDAMRYLSIGIKVTVDSIQSKPIGTKYGSAYSKSNPWTGSKPVKTKYSNKVEWKI